MEVTVRFITIIFLTWILIFEDFKAFVGTGCHAATQEKSYNQKQRLHISLKEMNSEA